MQQVAIRQECITNLQLTWKSSQNINWYSLINISAKKLTNVDNSNNVEQS